MSDSDSDSDSDSNSEPRSNRLAGETSPYLLQHARNPVDWYPWGPEALERARREDKPIFLSIGYSACHWCHVMERECFEEPSIAALMNALYVNIKVDREERPDIDEIYMKAVVAMTGSGGWPMSVFLTPDLRPFFGATYLPPVRKYDRPSFPDVLVGLAGAYAQDRAKVVEQAQQLTAVVSEEARTDLRGALLPDLLERAGKSLLGSWDRTWGGFGGAPKFPHSGELRALLRLHTRESDVAGAGDELQRTEALACATHTLERMARGGLYDQLGGGFHRYSTDAEFRIPHFEKMLYDNALLVVAYLDAHLVTRRDDFARIARESCDWALREMRTQEGAFASAQDADSEGEEGRFFVWTPDELEDLLGRERGRRAVAYFDVTPQGNFENGQSALWRPRDAQVVADELGLSVDALEQEMVEVRRLLLAAREQRVHPMTDDKVLVSWNGLMISALALAYQVLDEPRYLDAARAAARYLLDGLRAPDGGLFATARAGRAHLDACLDDYAFLIQALLDLYESDFDLSWLRSARALSERVQTRFRDHELGGYFTTGEGHEALITRVKSVHDGALPAGSGVQMLNLFRLGELSGDSALAQQAEEVAGSLAALANRQPRAFAHLLLALDFAAREPRQVVISGALDDAATQALLRALRTTFRPQRVVAFAGADADANASELPLLAGRAPDARGALAYVCRQQTCLMPTHSPADLS
ncbi:MAG TPA: thioredoxin domain-containing protein, partial [Polyangiales bacterium]|nr:thioredoxin domain-containing protein [Polyangiales bacterium]